VAAAVFQAPIRLLREELQRSSLHFYARNIFYNTAAGSSPLDQWSSWRASAIEKEGLIMASREPVTDRILGAVKRSPECDLDTLASDLPELTWNQVFLEIDRLSREGQILVTFGTGGRYMIRLPEPKNTSTTYSALS
jgi:hypothetical protein